LANRSTALNSAGKFVEAAKDAKRALQIKPCKLTPETRASLTVSLITASEDLTVKAREDLLIELKVCSSMAVSELMLLVLAENSQIMQVGS